MWVPPQGGCCKQERPFPYALRGVWRGSFSWGYTKGCLEVGALCGQVVLSFCFSGPGQPHLLPPFPARVPGRVPGRQRVRLHPTESWHRPGGFLGQCLASPGSLGHLGNRNQISFRGSLCLSYTLPDSPHALFPGDIGPGPSCADALCFPHGPIEQIGRAHV